MYLQVISAIPQWFNIIYDSEGEWEYGYIYINLEHQEEGCLKMLL